MKNLLLTVLLLSGVFSYSFAENFTSPQDTTYKDVIRAARINFGRVLQDPLGNFRGILNENVFMQNTGLSKEMALVTQVQGLYAIPMPKAGINVIPRVIVPIVMLPPLANVPIIANEVTENVQETGLSDIVLQCFVGPQKAEKIKWGIGPQLSFKTRTDELFEAAGWGGGFSFVGVMPVKQWGFTILASQLWGFENQFNTTLIRPFISYNFKTIPGFALSSSPKFVYDWTAEDGEGWSVPLGLGFTQAVPFSKTTALLIGIGAYKYVKTPTFGPEWSFNITLALMFAKDHS